MTGKEFEKAVKMAGYNQGEFAQLMGVHRQLIGRLYAMEDHVKPHWIFALAGLTTLKAAQTAVNFLADCDLSLELKKTEKTDN